MDAETTLSGVGLVMFMEAAVAGLNEVGYSPTGVLTGPNLTGTQAGTIAGASGTPPYRTFDAVDDKITITTTAANVLAKPQWTFLVRVAAPGTTAGARYVFRFSDAGTNMISLYRDNTVDEWQITVGGADIIKASTATRVNNSANMVLGAWCDGALVRCGWCQVGAGSGPGGQPIRWSDFAAANRLTASSACDFSAASFSSIAGISQVNPVSGDYYWLLLASSCQIDNAA